MPWVEWAKDDGKGLSRYVLPELGDVVRTAHPTIDRQVRGELEAVVAEIYVALASHDIRWARARYQPQAQRQIIRSPHDILNGSGDGTCLDLALLFAGVALGKELLPLVVVLEGHALVAVSRTRERRKAGGGARRQDEGNWTREGLLTDAETLRRLVDGQHYVLVECTGFAVTHEGLSDDVPEGRGREDGQLSYDEALRAGRAQLDEPQRPLRFAVDVAYLQDVSRFETLDPVGRGRIPDLRRRFDRVLRDNRVVGGRSRELAALDAFLAAADPRHLVLTGHAGMGKTALLAEWVRRLRARGDVDVMYHFVNRNTTTREELAASLVGQGAVAWGGADLGMLGAPAAVLESQWLELLDRYRLRAAVVVVDGTDEAEAAGWRVPEELLEAPAGVHVVVSARTMVNRDWRTRLGLPNAALLEVAGLDDAGVVDVLAVGGVPDWVREPEPLATLLDRAKGDPFYVGLLVTAINRGDITSPADLARSPASLNGYLAQWWNDVAAKTGQAATDTTFGYLAVVRGPITREELSSIDPADSLTKSVVGRVLDQIGRLLVGDRDGSGVTLAHWRLAEVVTQELLTPGDRAHLLRRLLAWCDAWPAHHYRYALVHGVAHRFEEAACPEDLVPVVDTLADPIYQKLRVTDADDTIGLLRDIDWCLAGLGVPVESVGPGPAPVPPVVALARMALEATDARERWLRPEAMVELARAGAADAAAHRLAMMGGQATGPWRAAARLVLAWVAARAHPGAARTLFEGVDGVHDGTLDVRLAVVQGRVLAALGAAPEPELRTWFGRGTLPLDSDRRRALAGLERLGGAPAYERGISGLFPVDHFVEGNEAGTYLAEEDAPPLVAYARDHPIEGDTLLARYIDLHAANPYTLYRNRSLLSVLAVVSCLPDPEQALRHAVHVTEGALAASPVRFAEHAHLAALALQVRGGYSGATSTVDRLRAAAVDGAVRLRATREDADQWGHHARRLAAHAEIAHVVFGDTATATGLLARAANVPFGYAGYRAPASLAVAQAFAVVDPADAAARQAALDAALESAHNVQEPAFCALTTARVNTMTSWWEGPMPDVAALALAFVRDPFAARFSPRHRIGEQFERRSRHDHLPIDHMSALRTPEAVATVLGVPRLAVARLNIHTEPGWVVLPDPDFAPMVATWLSAIVAATDLPAAQRARLTAALVPPAAPDPTALDAVLGRLVVALDPADEVLAELVRVLSDRQTSEPAGGWEAGVA